MRRLLAFKLLEKHKMGSAVDAGHRPRRAHGKKRMREHGSVSIPQEAFIAALRMGEE
jgi:hypothetical protein